MGCGDEKLSKYLTQTFIAHCNAMICQQVTLSGDAEWPKVADAVIEAGIGMCAQSCSIGSATGNLRSTMIGVISRSFICLWTAAMWERRTAQPSWGSASVSGRRKPYAALIRPRQRWLLLPELPFEHRSSRRSKPLKSSSHLCLGRIRATYG